VEDWPPDLRAKAVRYWPGAKAPGCALPRHLAAPSEWLGEREWRVVPSSGALKFTYDDVAFLIVPTMRWVDALADQLSDERSRQVRALKFVVLSEEGTVIARRPVDLDAFSLIEDEVPADSAQELFDTDWRRETLLDTRSQEQAQRVLEAIGEEELARRSDPDRIADLLRPVRAKYALDTPEPDICPVCEVKALAVEGFDQLGGNLGPGTCLVCGYYRSEFISDQEAITVHAEMLIGDVT
jgi:hypothetical protein